MVCFAIYSASNAVAQAHRAVLAPWQLTYTQYIALLEVSGSPEGLTVSDLGERMHLDSGTLSPLLRRLEQRGLVARERNAQDERIVTVTATHAGQSTRRDLSEAISSINLAYGFRSMESAHTLVASLNRITDGMRQLKAAVHT